MNPEQYGPLALVVALAGNLGAAAIAFRAAFAGKMIWEPQVQNFNNAPTRIVNVFVIIGIAILFFATRGHRDLFPIAYWAVGFGIAAFVFFLLDVLVRSIVIIRCDSADPGIVGGFWLTERARQILVGHPAAYERGDLLVNPQTGEKPRIPVSVADLFCTPRKLVLTSPWCLSTVVGLLRQC